MTSAAPGKTLLRPHPLTAIIRGWVALLLVAFNLLRDEQFRKLLNPSLWHEIPLTKLGIAMSVVIVVFGIAGLAAWWFTRYVVDSEEVRVETGLVTRKVQQIAISRIQSVDVIQTLAPRLLGLAEVKIDVGANSATRIRYLRRRDAYAMRDFLLNAQRASTAVVLPVPTGTTEPAARPGSLLHDQRTDERLLVQIPPLRLAISAVCSAEFLIAIIGVIGVIGYGVVQKRMGLLAFFAPMLFGVVKVIYDRVVGQWNYRLALSERGLKVSRGLFDLTSQSIPLHRIQGVAIRQPLFWRVLGLHRIDIDVLGYGHATSNEDGHSTSTILLPAGTVDDVAAALRACFPTLRLDDIEMTPVSPKRRYFHPIGWRGARYGVNADVLSIENGWWHLHHTLIPHQRIQSVLVYQGPLDQRLGLATVYAQTADGPVNGRIPHVDLATALAFAQAELDRATTARRGELGYDA